MDYNCTAYTLYTRTATESEKHRDGPGTAARPEKEVGQKAVLRRNEAVSKPEFLHNSPVNVYGWSDEEIG